VFQVEKGKITNQKDLLHFIMILELLVAAEAKLRLNLLNFKLPSDIFKSKK